MSEINQFYIFSEYTLENYPISRFCLTGLIWGISRFLSHESAPLWKDLFCQRAQISSLSDRYVPSGYLAIRYFDRLSGLIQVPLDTLADLFCSVKFVNLFNNIYWLDGMCFCFKYIDRLHCTHQLFLGQFSIKLPSPTNVSSYRAPDKNFIHNYESDIRLINNQHFVWKAG